MARQWMVEQLDQATGPGYYSITRHYVESNNVECVAIQSTDPSQFRRGGGAKRKNTSTAEMDKATLQKSLSRTRVKIRQKCLALGVDRLLTLTYRENMTDKDRAWRDLKIFIRHMRSRWPEFAYVAVMEYQMRGAVHMHLAVRGYFHANTVRAFWHRVCGEDNGNIHLSVPHTGQTQSSRIAGYISKYVGKDFEENSEFNRKRYSSGGPIPEPKKSVGWVAMGGPVNIIFRDVVKDLTRRRVRFEFQSQDWLIYYCCT